MSRILSQLRNGGYSLVEILVVIAVAAILGVLAIQAFNAVSQAANISRAATQILGVISIAKQRATSENQTAVIRILGDSDGIYQAFQIYERGENGDLTAIERAVFLPTGTCLATNPAISSVFSLPRFTSGSNDPVVPGFSGNYRFIEFEVRPTGRFGLEIDQQWFVTVIGGDADPGASTPPANFATIQIDPVNGGTTLYRP